MAEGTEDRGLFRKESLERLSSPERLDQLLEVVDRKSWAPLCAAGALVLALLLWAVLGSIPIHVEGRGILVRPRKVVELQSPGPGRVIRLAVEVGDAVRAGEPVAFIERPDLLEQLRLHKQKAAELRAQSRPAAARTDASLRDHIERSRAHAERLRDERLAAIEEERERLDTQEAVARELTDALRERLAGQKRLLAEGLVAPSEVDASERELVDGLERLYEVETLRGALRTARLEADEQYYDRMQAIAESTFELGQELADVEREIARLEAQLAEESRIRAGHDGRMLDLSTSVGAYVGAGARLGAIEVNDASSSLQSIAYFRVRDGKRLEPGMPIQVAPDTVERERYGSLRGVVRAVSRFPVSAEHAATVVGNRLVAESLIEAGFLIEVSADLELLSTDPLRYAWTSSRGPEGVEISAGTTTRARAAVEHVRPIALVIPLFKSAAGLD